MNSKLPSIVIVGRPNVGKSTLFNRLTGTRRSIVTNEPGITRDRIYGTANWEGRSFEVVDTGGIVPEDKAGIPGEILRQASVAIKNATRVVQIVDGRVGPTPLDQELAQLLRRAGKPPILAVNKVDTPQQAVEFSAPFYKLGDEVFPISAEHGFGVDVLLDALTEQIPKGEPEPEAPHVNIAIMRTFVQMRALLATDEDLRRKIEQMEKRYDAKFSAVFATLKQMLEVPFPRKGEIGFHASLRTKKLAH